jgi:peptide/nickel transport system substrate-binding protein
MRNALFTSAGVALAGTAGWAPDQRYVASGAPRRDGQLRVVAKGSTTSSLNPLLTTDTARLIAIVQIYDQLVQLRGDEIVNQLAKSVLPSADATRWTIELRCGAVFHDGRPVTATDLAYSLRTLGDPKRSPNYGQLFGDVDMANIKVRDSVTLEVPLRRARGTSGARR